MATSTRATMAGAQPADPIAWQQWAVGQDADRYGWKNSRQIGFEDLPHLRDTLVKQGKWNPEWDAALADPAYQSAQHITENGDVGSPAAKTLDLSALNGYTTSDARSRDRSGVVGYFDPTGNNISSRAVERGGGALKSGDYRNFLAATVGVLGAGAGIEALAGAGAAGATTGSGGLGGLGGTTAEQLAIMQANGMTAAEISAATGGQVAGYTAADVAAMNAATGATGTTAATGSSSIVDALKTGVQKMGTGDWLNAAVSVYGIANQPKAPDTSGINSAAVSSAQLSQDAFNWFKTEYERTAPQRDRAAARDDEIAGANLEGMNFATQQAKDLALRNKTVFQPVEDRIVSDSMGFDTPARRAQAVAEATADVEGAAGRAQQANNRAMMRAGVTLDSPAAAALMQDASLAKAKMVAGSTGAATRNVEQQGWARINDAAALGKGTVGNQATQQQIATNAGTAGVNAGTAAVNATQAGTGIMQTGFNTAQHGLSTAGQLFGQAGQLTSATRGQDLGFLNNAFSAYMKSSKKVKKNTAKMADGQEAVDAVMATPVKDGWEYDPAKGGPDDGGQKHTGPMAEDVRATMGEATAPGGEFIDMRKMGGTMLAAIQSVVKDVAELRDQMATRARMGNATKEA